MKLTFWGAVGTVTGSMHEVQVGGSRFLLDCGMFQGRRAEAHERNMNFPFRGGEIDAVVLSHAHIDHSGNLPTLVKNGFRGPIYATPATADLCAPMLRDSAHIQEKDSEFVEKRFRRKRSLDPTAKNGAVPPLYTTEDADQTIPLFHPVPLSTPQQIANGATYQSCEAGHILGSSAIVVTEHVNGKEIRLGFSGDVGRRGLPITNDPALLPPVDYLIMESTYGGRLHKDPGTVADKLANVITRTAARGGKVIVPAFAVGRTQQLILMLHELAQAERIPRIPVYVDSPLAVQITEVFRKHAELFDEGARAFLVDGGDPFAFGRLHYIRDVGESKALNDLHGPFVVLSASGMCEAGRILHHLRNNIEDPRNTILITGFQAQNTLGRKLVDRLPEVAIYGEPMRVRAEVETINELSGHADQRELLEWLKPVADVVKRIFIVHGEPVQSLALSDAIRDRFGIDTVLPSRGQSFDFN